MSAVCCDGYRTVLYKNWAYNDRAQDVSVGICILASMLPNGLLSIAVRIKVNTLVTNTLSAPLDTTFVRNVARSVISNTSLCNDNMR